MQLILDFQELNKQEAMQVHGGAPIVYHHGTGFLGQLFTVLVNMGQSERFLVDRNPATLMECQGWLKTYKYAAYTPPEELRKFALPGQRRMDTGLSVVRFPPTGKAFRECHSFVGKTCNRKKHEPFDLDKFIEYVVKNELMPFLAHDLPKEYDNAIAQWEDAYKGTDSEKMVKEHIGSIKSKLAYNDKVKEELQWLLPKEIKKNIEKTKAKALAENIHQGSLCWLENAPEISGRELASIHECKIASLKACMLEDDIKMKLMSLLSFGFVNVFFKKAKKLTKLTCHYKRQGTDHLTDDMHWYAFGYSALDISKVKNGINHPTSLLPCAFENKINSFHQRNKVFLNLSKVLTPILDKWFPINPGYAKEKLEIATGRQFSPKEWHPKNEKQLWAFLKSTSNTAYKDLRKKKQEFVKHIINRPEDFMHSGTLGYDCLKVTKEINACFKCLKIVLQDPTVLTDVYAGGTTYIERRMKELCSRAHETELNLEFRYFQELFPGSVLVKPEGYDINDKGEIIITKKLEDQVKENITYVNMLGLLRYLNEWGAICFNEPLPTQGKGFSKVCHGKRIDRRTFISWIPHEWKQRDKGHWVAVMDLIYKQIPYLPNKIWDIIGLDLKKARVKKSLFISHLIKRRTWLSK